MGFYIIERLPIIFSKDYNVRFCGLQCLHPFDTEKGAHVLYYLKIGNVLREDQITTALEITDEELLEVHSMQYLDSLKVSEHLSILFSYKISDTVSQIAEIPLLHFVPNIFIQQGYLRPMRFQTAGSLKAAKLAFRNGWSINLGGGFIHCSSDQGGSFSPYADVSLVAKYLLLEENDVRNLMIVDLSARQGNGYQRDFMDIKSVYMFDMYNVGIYPKDEVAKIAISKRVELQPKTEDEVYLRKLRINLTKALNEFEPDYMVYIAGTDILDGDNLGELSVSPEGIVMRDEIVFTKARALDIPICMLLGTGFTKQSAQIISSSIMNLKEKGLLPSNVWTT